MVVNLCLVFLLTIPTGSISDTPKVHNFSVCQSDNSTYSLTFSWESGIEYIRPNPSPIFYFFLTTNGLFHGQFTRTIKTKKMVMVIIKSSPILTLLLIKQPVTLHNLTLQQSTTSVIVRWNKIGILTWLLWLTSADSAVWMHMQLL